MFRPLLGHHQAFFKTNRQFAAYVVGIPTMFTKFWYMMYVRSFIK